MSASLYDLFRSRFPSDLDAPFIETAEGRSYSYRDLDLLSGRFARLLADLGVVKGDRVAVRVGKSPEAIMLYIACLRAGAIYLPLNTAYGPAEVGYFLNDAEPRVVVTRPEDAAWTREIMAASGDGHVLTLDDAGGGDLIERTGDRDPEFATVAAAADDIAAILYTSGTTGRSKGAMLSHGNLAANALTLHRAWGFVSGDVLLHVLPIFHTHGLFVATHCVLLNGGTMIFHDRFDTDRTIDDLLRATVLMGVPTHYARLLANPRLDARACANMRLFISGSAPLRSETFESFRARTGHVILERYGMTEAGMITANPLAGPRLAGAVGPPLSGVEARVVNEHGTPLPSGETGVLEIRGPNVFKGYWRMPEKTREEFRDDGFFITGDLARIDAAGYVWIVGRAKDLVISGGFNVYPKEIEICIDALPGVVESAVIGLAHPDFGEAVTAVVVRAPGADGPDEAEIIARLKARLANFKVPKRVFFADELPRNAMGKVQKAALREAHAGTFGGGS